MFETVSIIISCNALLSDELQFFEWLRILTAKLLPLRGYQVIEEINDIACSVLNNAVIFGTTNIFQWMLDQDNIVSHICHVHV